MNRIFIFTLCFLSVMIFSQQKQIYESPNLKEKINTHKIVAILPFDVSVSFKKKPENYDAAAVKEQELKFSKDIQSGLFTYLLNRSKKFTVEFQDIEKTNLLLKKAGVIDSLKDQTREDLAKILGVDAVIGGSFEMLTTKSEAGAIASVFLLGFGSNTGTGSLTMNIYDGVDGNLLWRFYYYKNDSIFSSTNEMMEKIMRKVAKNFPYEK